MRNDGTPKRAVPYQGLGPRQIDILRAMGFGLNTKEIAQVLEIQPKTVEYHRQYICTKLKTDMNYLPRLAWAFGLAPLCSLMLLLAPVAQAAGPATNAVPVVLVWDKPVPADASLVYRVYSTTNAALPTDQWGLVATLPNPGSYSATQYGWTNNLKPGVYFFTMTASNFWGTSFFSNTAGTPPPPPLLNNLWLVPPVP